MNKFMSFILSETGIKIFLILMVVLFVWSIIDITVKKITLNHYKKVSIGMSEEEMLSVMGGRPSVSNYQNRKKFEWFIKAVSSTTYNNGIANTVHSPKKSVVITTENGKVISIEPHNI